MPVRKLEHYNLLTTRLADTVAFYTDVLGMRNGPFPGTDASQGAWIYDETDTAVVHVQAVDPRRPEVKLGRVRERLGELAARMTVENLVGSGAVEHVAFECDGYDEFAARLARAGIAMAKNDVPQMGLRQIFVRDPNEVIIELNFR